MVTIGSIIEKSTTRTRFPAARQSHCCTDSGLVLPFSAKFLSKLNPESREWMELVNTNNFGFYPIRTNC
jgi:hypothetical protein